MLQVPIKPIQFIEVFQEALGKISSAYVYKMTIRMPSTCKAVIAAKEFFDESSLKDTIHILIKKSHYF